MKNERLRLCMVHSHSIDSHDTARLCNSRHRLGSNHIEVKRGVWVNEKQFEIITKLMFLLLLSNISWISSVGFFILGRPYVALVPGIATVIFGTIFVYLCSNNWK